MASDAVISDITCLSDLRSLPSSPHITDIVIPRRSIVSYSSFGRFTVDIGEKVQSPAVLQTGTIGATEH